MDDAATQTPSLDKVGRRHYVRDTPMAVKDVLKLDFGFKWDPEERAWYTGKGADHAEKALAAVTATIADNARCGRYAKVGDAWCVRIEDGAAGAVVTVVKGSGEKKRETLGEQVEPGVWTVKRAKRVKKFKGSGGGYTKRRTCRSPGCNNPANLNAPHHRAMEGYCGYCAFDEFDC